MPEPEKAKQTEFFNAFETKYKSAKEAAEKNMQVFILGIGSPDGSPIPVERGSNDFRKDKDGNVIINQQPTATTEDYLHLVVAAVVAANEKERHIKQLKPEELPLPIDSADLLYNATKAEITQIIATVLELRNAWYEIPAVMKQNLLTNDNDDEEKPKN